MQDLGWRTNYFIAENVRDGVNNFVKATENDVFLIESYITRLKSRLTEEVEINFAERLPDFSLCLYPSIIGGKSKAAQKAIALSVAEELREESGCGLIIRYFEKRVPKNRQYLLFNSAQSLEVAMHARTRYVPEGDAIFHASIDFAHSEKREPHYLIELLCALSHHLRCSSRWRTGVLCLEYAEILIAEICENLDSLSISPERLSRLAEQVGANYNEFDLAERAIALSLKTLTFLEKKLGLQEGELEDYIDTSYWKDCHEIFWLTHQTYGSHFEKLSALVAAK